MFITASVIILFFGTVCGYTSYKVCTFFDKSFDADLERLGKKIDELEQHISEIRSKMY